MKMETGHAQSERDAIHSSGINMCSQLCSSFMDPTKGICQCGPREDCVGLCSLLVEPLPPEEYALGSSMPYAAAPVSSSSFDFEQFIQQEEMAPVNKEESMKKTKGRELKSISREQGEEAPQHLPETATEWKRITERKRREDINKGFEKLAQLVLAINPNLVKTRNSNTKKAPTTESLPIGRVELVNGAVTTLAHVYKENEINKVLVSRLTDGSVKDNEGVGMPPDQQLDKFLSGMVESFLPSFDEVREKCNEVSLTNLSRSGSKRLREKK